MKNNLKYLALIFATTIITAQQKNTAEKIFINGNIITVDAKNSTAQAVAVSNGKILAVGTNSTIEKLKDKNTIVVDLKGKTVFPDIKTILPKLKKGENIIIEQKKNKLIITTEKEKK